LTYASVFINIYRKIEEQVMEDEKPIGGRGNCPGGKCMDTFEKYHKITMYISNKKYVCRQKYCTMCIQSNILRFKKNMSLLEIQKKQTI
jgi:hypothetical protein